MIKHIMKEFTGSKDSEEGMNLYLGLLALLLIDFLRNLGMGLRVQGGTDMEVNCCILLLVGLLGSSLEAL